MGSQQGQPTPEMMAQMQEQMAVEMKRRMADFGKALGLHPDFMADVAQRGQVAVIDRSELVDLTGAHGRLLSIVQRLGATMQDKAEETGEPMPPGEMMEWIAMLADEHQVDRGVALRLVGAAVEVLRAAMGNLAKGKPNGEMGTRDAGRTGG